MPFINTPVPGAREYYPLNEPEIGTLLKKTENDPLLFKSITIRGETFKNRIFVSPMCQYSAHDGHATDWHLVHIGGFASRGVGAITMEASAVVPEGRISPEDLGIWSDTHIPKLKQIVEFSHAQGTKIGLQLAHAGRKASTYAPWVKEKSGGMIRTASKDEGGWPDNVWGPSDIPYSENHPPVKSLSKAQLTEIEEAFVAAIKRCEAIGFDFIEIHAAHGYLFNSFVSPLSNNRTDEYGGSLENRLRFPLQVIQRCRAEWPNKPLIVRISATDWAEVEKGEDGEWKSWGIEQSKIFAGELKKIGIDLLDCSTGANWQKQVIPIKLGYQVPFAEAIKKAHPDLLVGTVGLIVEPRQAESYLRDGKADVIYLARELLRNPHWALTAAQEFKVPMKLAAQYERIQELPSQCI